MHVCLCANANDIKFILIRLMLCSAVDVQKPNTQNCGCFGARLLRKEDKFVCFLAESIGKLDGKVFRKKEQKNYYKANTQKVNEKNKIINGSKRENEYYGSRFLARTVCSVPSRDNINDNKTEKKTPWRLLLLFLLFLVKKVLK
jgi:hypothetical protein